MSYNQQGGGYQQNGMGMGQKFQHNQNMNNQYNMNQQQQQQFQGNFQNLNQPMMRNQMGGGNVMMNQQQNQQNRFQNQNQIGGNMYQQNQFRPQNQMMNQQPQNNFNNQMNQGYNNMNNQYQMNTNKQQNFNQMQQNRYQPQINNQQMNQNSMNQRKVYPQQQQQQLGGMNMNRNMMMNQQQQQRPQNIQMLGNMNQNPQFNNMNRMNNMGNQQYQMNLPQNMNFPVQNQQNQQNQQNRGMNQNLMVNQQQQNQNPQMMNKVNPVMNQQQQNSQVMNNQGNIQQSQSNQNMMKQQTQFLPNNVNTGNHQQMMPQNLPQPPQHGGMNLQTTSSPKIPSVSSARSGNQCLPNAGNVSTSNKFVEQLNRQSQQQIRIQKNEPSETNKLKLQAARTGSGGSGGGWKSSNVGGIGSKEDLELRINTAKKEQEWKGAGQKEGIEIWRIENFGVKRWNKMGEFYNGDCFIVLKTYGHQRSFRYDVFYWIGSQSTIDEKGTAALKTIELDDYFGTVPVQYRECEGHESTKFLSLFPNGMRILNGGIDSGFRKVEEHVYSPRLLQVKGRKYVRCVEVPKSVESLNNGDVFILDLGMKCFLWSGSKANPQEKYKAGQVMQDIKDKRSKGGKKVEIERIEEIGCPEFWNQLGVNNLNNIRIRDESEVVSDLDFENKKTIECGKKLFQLSDVTGEMKFTLVQECQKNQLLESQKLDHDDVFIIDLENEIIAWIGKGASKDERRQAILYATNYLVKSHKPEWCRICRIEDGREGPKWKQIFK